MSPAQQPAQLASWLAPSTPIDIEALLVWTYRRQRADVVIERGYGLNAIEAEIDGVMSQGISGCGVVSVERIGLLGTRVDGGGSGSGALHPDAELVHESVCRLMPPHRRLVVRHARAGTRPDTMAGIVPRPFPVLTPRGLPQRRYEAWDKSHKYGCCLVQWLPSPARIEAARMEYATWHRMLGLLAWSLRADARLSAHEVLPPAAPKPQVAFCV